MSKASEGGYGCVYDTPEGQQTVTTKCLLLTAPAYVTAEIVEAMSPTAADSSTKLLCIPGRVRDGVVQEGFVPFGRYVRASEGGLTGFGQLHPRSQGIRTLGTIARRLCSRTTSANRTTSS